ncbi:hypothetical protein [Marinifilum sp. D714]|uniref:hypothetical protein n=1 Tax=Marinifilum sp. D714 TaxID=2937523 RepID=UPI0027D296D3|nr:hypothetical protein [Marinifilum sp. D714]
METYICFYTTKPFWTGEKPDIESLISNADAFTKSLSEKTIEYENDSIYLAFCKDGLVMTRIKELESRRDEFKAQNGKEEPIPPAIQFTSEYLNYLNAIQVILSSSLLKVDNFAYFKNSSIRSGEAFTMSFKDGKFNSSGVPDNLTESFYSGRYLSQYNRNYPIQIDKRITFRRAIKEEVFRTCYDDLNLIIDDTEAIQMLSQVNSALSEYHNLNFRQSLVQSWFVIEYYINKKWIEFLYSKQAKIDTDKNRIDSTRRDFLTGRDMTSSILSNILELNDLIDYDIFEKINTVRGKRNVAVHNLDLIERLADKMKSKPGKKKDKRISTDDCWDAFLVIKDFFKTEYNLDLKMSGGFSYSTL